MSGPVADVAVRVVSVSKSFGGITALDNISFDVARGEIHALLGENGAGKSTILKILSGVESLDGGQIEIGGSVMHVQSPEAARRAGVAMIFQEMSLIPTLTVAQNIFLTREQRDRVGFIDDRAGARRARDMFASFGVDIDPTSLVSDIGAGQRQLTEIVKAISHTASVLILDEPTSALSAAEVDKLFAFLRRVKAEGVSIIYVSHRMDEIMRIADRATILRDGRHVITEALSKLTIEAIVEYMVGRRTGFSGLHGDSVREGAIRLEVKSVFGRSKPQGASLIARRGEVVGIAGLLGSGRSSLARIICGLDPIASGEIRIDGHAVSIDGPGTAIRHGIALIPEDRIRQGLVSMHSVADNISLPVLDRVSRLAWIRRSKLRELVTRQIAKLRIKTASAESPVRTLSGGNQQKVVVAKALSAEPEVLVLDEPTAGIDIGSKTEIVALIRELARSGKTILLISSELPELLAASDRIVVMAKGRTMQEFTRSEILVAGADPVEALALAEQKLQVILQGALQDA